MDGARVCADGTFLRRLATVAGVLVPAAAATIVYSHFLGQWFFRDDTAWLLAAQDRHFFHFLKNAFTVPSGPTPYWRPLADVYFFIMYRVFALQPLPYHVANVLFHAAAAAVTVILIRRLSGSLAAGVIAGLLFAVAPAYAEGVIWISTIGASMAAFFCVTTMVLFLRYLDGDGGRTTLALATVSFLAALLSLEGSVCLPALLILLGLAARPPRDAAERRRFVTALLPFIALGIAYGVMQTSADYLNPSPEHSLDWHAGPRLLDRLLWLSLPLSSWDYSSWVDGAHWAALGVFTLAAGTALSRRQWIVPALFGATVLALVPSSFLTGMFEYRWVYVASPLWAGFVATLAWMLIRWLYSQHVAAAGIAVLVIAAGIGAALLPHDTLFQRGMAEQAAQLEQINSAFKRGCPGLGSSDTVYILPLPIVEPPGQGLAPSLIRLVRPGAAIVYVGAQGLPAPAPGDCIIEWRDGSYVATLGSGYTPSRFWTVSLVAGCPEAVPWERAGYHIDKLAIVRGPVVNVVHVGVATVLQIGEANKFNITIPGDYRYAFPNPDRLFLGQTICVRGVARLIYPGVLDITVQDPTIIYVE